MDVEIKRQKGFTIFYKFVFDALSVLFLLIPIYGYFSLDKGYINISLILVSIQFCLFMVFGLHSNKTLYSNWTNPSYILILGIVIVHLQNIINVQLNFDDFSSYIVRPVRSDTYVKFAYLSIIGVIVLLISLFSFSPDHIKKYAYREGVNPRPWLYVVVVCLIGFLATSDVHSLISGEGYKNIETATADIYMELMFGFSLVIYISLKTIEIKWSKTKQTLRSYIKSFPKLFWTIISVYIVVRLFSGDRGPVIYTLLYIFFSYLYVTRKRFKLTTVALAVFFAAVFITIIGIARLGALRASLGDRLGAAVESQLSGGALLASSVCPPTQELANSSMCLAIAIDGIDSKDIDYQYGRYTFYNLLSAIPFVGSFLQRLCGVDMGNVSSSSYITKRGLGKHPAYGLGTSAIADFYLEFGLFGVIIGFISMGYIYRFVDFIFLDSVVVSPVIMISSLQIAAYAIYIPRYSLSGLFYKVFFCLFLYFIF